VLANRPSRWSEASDAGELGLGFGRGPLSFARWIVGQQDQVARWLLLALTFIWLDTQYWAWRGSRRRQSPRAEHSRTLILGGDCCDRDDGTCSQICGLGNIPANHIDQAGRVGPAAGSARSVGCSRRGFSFARTATPTRLRGEHRRSATSVRRLVVVTRRFVDIRRLCRTTGRRAVYVCVRDFAAPESLHESAKR